MTPKDLTQTGDVAQRESSAFARRRSRVQIPPSPLSCVGKDVEKFEVGSPAGALGS